MRIKLGSVTRECTDSEVQTAMDQSGGTIAWQIESDALSPWDSKALSPDCKAKTKAGKDIILYKEQENIFFWISVGLVGLIILIILVAALKGGGGASDTIIYR